MEEFLAEDKQNMEQVTNVAFDESKQRELVLEDEEEDFLDDGKEPSFSRDSHRSSRHSRIV